MNNSVLIAHTKDRVGVTSELTSLIADGGCNIEHLDHFLDHESYQFFIRIVFDPSNEVHDAIHRYFNAHPDMHYELHLPNQRQKMAIFVSKMDHAMMELILRVRAGEIPVEISMVISNHDTHRDLVEQFGIPFHHVPFNKEIKARAEQQMIDLLDGQADFIVLARYMQILSPEFIERYKFKIINIHHSFLPAFIGAKPYAQAYDRGVKLIGATAHYVTSELDGGPIIQQDVLRVNHRYTKDELVVVGRHVENRVLADAVMWHAEHKVLVHGNKTIVLGV